MFFAPPSPLPLRFPTSGGGKKCETENCAAISRRGIAPHFHAQRIASWGEGPWCVAALFVTLAVKPSISNGERHDTRMALLDLWDIKSQPENKYLQVFDAFSNFKSTIWFNYLELPTNLKSCHLKKSAGQNVKNGIFYYDRLSLLYCFKNAIFPNIISVKYDFYVPCNIGVLNRSSLRIHAADAAAKLLQEAVAHQNSILYKKIIFFMAWITTQQMFSSQMGHSNIRLKIQYNSVCRLNQLMRTRALSLLLDHKTQNISPYSYEVTNS